MAGKAVLAVFAVGLSLLGSSQAFAPAAAAVARAQGTGSTRFARRMASYGRERGCARASARLLSMSAEAEAQPAAAAAAVAEEEPLESNEPAPATFVQCIQQAARATEKAMADGYKLLEVEFPPLNVDFLEDSTSSAYDISRANVRLASQFGEFFATDGKRVSVLLPDAAELERAIEDEMLSGFFGGGKSGEVEPIPGTDMYVAIIFSCQELPDLRKLAELSPETPIVFFNLKLDTQRGDLGLPAFPPKTLHWEFMSKIKPVYLLRARAYSKSLARPPYLVNYQGAQFRVYPGAYQSLLDVGAARYKQVAKSVVRPALGEFKDILTASLKLDEGDGEVASFFRKGYKTRTWWEDDKAFEQEQSTNWRT